QTPKVEAATANILIALSLLSGTPLFIVFGCLSDKIGRKPITLGGRLRAARTHFPLLAPLTHYANPARAPAPPTAPGTPVAHPGQCSCLFNPVGTSKFVTSCDIAKGFLARNSVNYANEEAPAGTLASIRIGEQTIASFSGAGMPADQFKAESDAFNARMTE